MASRRTYYWLLWMVYGVVSIPTAPYEDRGYTVNELLLLEGKRLKRILRRRLKRGSLTSEGKNYLSRFAPGSPGSITTSHSLFDTLGRCIFQTVCAGSIPTCALRREKSRVRSSKTCKGVELLPATIPKEGSPSQRGRGGGLLALRARHRHQKPSDFSREPVYATPVKAAILRVIQYCRGP